MTSEITVDWGSYKVFSGARYDLLRDLPRPEARARYAHLMASKSDRKLQLSSLLAQSGITLGTDNSGVQDLNDWFCANVEPDADWPGWLTSFWYSVVTDLSLFIGDVLIERNPHLYWEFFTWGKKNVAYQQAVIMGFRNSDAKFRVNFDLEAIIAAYGHRILASRGSIARYGTVRARGVEIDIDAASARARGGREDEQDFFWKLLVSVTAGEL